MFSLHCMFIAFLNKNTSAGRPLRFVGEATCESSDALSLDRMRIVCVQHSDHSATPKNTSLSARSQHAGPTPCWWGAPVHGSCNVLAEGRPISRPSLRYRKTLCCHICCWKLALILEFVTTTYIHLLYRSIMIYIVLWCIVYVCVCMLYFVVLCDVNVLCNVNDVQ